VVHAADGDTSGAHQLDNTIDPGARGRETDWLNGGRPIIISDKVRPYHLERKAVLYVRQSSPIKFCIPAVAIVNDEARGTAILRRACTTDLDLRSTA